jgi:hypothetical protein
VKKSYVAAYVNASIRIGVAVALLSVISLSAFAQAKGDGKAKGKGGGAPAFQPPSGPTPKTPEGKPDFSGLWQRPYTPDMTKNARDQQGYAEAPFTPGDSPQARQALIEKGQRAELPFTKLGLEQWVNYDAAKGDYTGACLPFGLVRSMNSPDPIQVMQNPKYLAMLYEQNTWFHVIPIDGRPHNKNAAAAWFGDSVGHWEGDTLVVDTNNFNGKTKLDTIGHPASDQLHVVERFTRTDLGHIAYEMTIDDPKIYTKAWKNTRTFTLRPDWEVMEYSCEENNKGYWEGRIKVPDFAK